MKTKKPLYGHRYNITLFFNPEPFPAVFMQTYTDLFGEQYTDFFMDDAGKIFELSSVGQWERFAVFGVSELKAGTKKGHDKKHTLSNPPMLPLRCHGKSQTKV